MIIIQIASIAIITAICVAILKDAKSQGAYLVGIAGGLIILILVMDLALGIFDTITSIVTRSGLDGNVARAIIQIVGIGYITEFSAGICEDCGNKGLADKLILGGKIVIMVIAMPIVITLFDTIAGLL